MLYELFVLKNIQPNYIHYPFGVQESLALDVPVRIQSDDPVHSFPEAIERINLAKYFAPVRSNNSSSHDRVMLLRVILFSYMTSRKNISLRELESLCRTDCRFLYLSNYEILSHQAFKRVLDQYEGDNISRTRGGNHHISQIYAEKGHREGCESLGQCCRFGRYRRVGKNVVMEELQGKADENLESEEGKRLCRQRSIQVE